MSCVPGRLWCVLPFILAAGLALSDPVVSWPSLALTPSGRPGLFGVWGAEQQKVLAALRALERKDPDRDVAELRQAFQDDPTDFEAAELLAVRYWRKGMYPEAEGLFRRILELDPAATRCRLNLAEFLLELGSKNLAVKVLAEGIRIQTQSVVLRERLARLHTTLENHGRAAELWQEVVGLRPRNVAAHVELAKSLLRDGQNEAAKGVISAAARLAGSDEVALAAVAEAHRAAGNSRGAVEIWSRLVKGKAARRSAAIQLGIASLHAGEYREARNVFEDIAAEPGANVVAIAAAATAALGVADYDGVVKWCRRLREEGHGETSAVMLSCLWLVRGDAAAIEAVWAARGQDAQGRKEAYQEFAVSMAANADARRELALLLSRAEVLQLAGWLEQRIQVLQAARKLAPGSVMLGEELARDLAAAGHAEQELALREELAQAHPDIPRVCQGLVRALLARGQRARAEEVNAGFVKRFFADLESRVAAAEMAIAKGVYEAAIADCQSVLARHPHDERPYRLLLDATVRAGKYTEAVAAIRTREGALPRFVPGPLEQAILAMAEGRPADAVAQARRGIRRTPMDHRLWLIGAAALEATGDTAGAIPLYRAAGWLQEGHLSTQLAIARAAARCGERVVAADAYRAALAIMPEARELQLEFADALLHWGDHDAAIALLASLAGGTTAARDAIATRLAEAYLVKGDPGKALELVREVLARDPADPVARRVALAACRSLDDIASAIKVCELAAARDPQGGVGADLGLLFLIEQRYKDAEGRLAAALAGVEDAPRRAELGRLHAIACIALGLPQKALRALDDALRYLPPQALPADDLALAIAALKVGTDAEGVLAAAGRIRPTRGGWLRTLAARVATDRQLATIVLTAYAACKDGWHARGAKLFSAASEQAPNEPLPLYEAATAFAKAGRFAEALAVAQKLTGLCPKAGDTQLLLASVLDKTGKQEAALSAYESALASLDKEATAERLAIGERLRAAGRIDAAVDAFRSLLAADPVNVLASVRLAQLYSNHKPEMLAEAEQLATTAARVRPKDAECRDTLGWILFLQKKPEAARGEITAAIALDHRNASYYYHLGMTDYIGKQRARARRALSLALRLDPKLPEADSARAALKVIEAEEPLSSRTVPER